MFSLQIFIAWVKNVCRVFGRDEDLIIYLVNWNCELWLWGQGHWVESEGGRWAKVKQKKGEWIIVFWLGWTTREMFRTKGHTNKKSEDVKKSAGKVLDTKKDTPTRAKVIQYNSCGMNGIIKNLEFLCWVILTSMSFFKFNYWAVTDRKDMSIRKQRHRLWFGQFDS